jgi:hypothetical protein
MGGVEEELHGSIPPNNPQCTTGGAGRTHPAAPFTAETRSRGGIAEKLKIFFSALSPR